MHSRREFLKVATTGLAAAVASTSGMPAQSAPAGRRLRFIQMDVFASRRLQGNPLAVFLDGRGLADAEMRAIARETNLSETTFIFPRDPAVERIHGVRVRIFTPDEEHVATG
ncbi:MAG TPA: PhzF family phenazine biosynthesis protein [Steroidobacteraceae bacterium]|jgi:trans-2,3-dihydro-3-hydroxyanthranilate isomerase|nr:PhzF family phenazine biosynthesis protein [Steroidobacteraceae bacterium]